ncbi:hypothetical protein Bca101_056325 [Brassica carinata]
MKTRRKDALTSSRRSTRALTSVENSKTIPIDLFIEILLRLPAKSIARCRCVSKSWAYILRRTCFTELFLTRSRSRPQILFSCRKNGELFFFSTPHVQNPERSSRVTASYHMKFPFDDRSYYEGCFVPVNGLVCLPHLLESKKRVPMICNPSTGQSFVLPKVRTKGCDMVYSYLVYDPVGKEFKLFSMTARVYGSCEEHQVLTLGTRKLSWRMIECSVSVRYAQFNGICIDGVLYYIGALNGPPWGHGIVCFDVRSEKFKFVNKAEDMELWSGTTLVNYKGKLGVLLSFGYITQDSEYFELWVLIDAEKHEWSKHVCVLPPLWKNIVSDTMLEFVGMTSRGEIVMSTCYLSNPFYVYYYNIEDNTITRVEVQGMEAFMKDNTVTSIESQGMDAFVYCRVHISLSHVEDVKLM